MTKLSQSQFRGAVFLALLALLMSIAPLTAEASIKIDAGDLLKIILDEAKKDSGSKEPPTQSNNTPPTTGTGNGSETNADINFEEVLDKINAFGESVKTICRPIMAKRKEDFRDRVFDERYNSYLIQRVWITPDVVLVTQQVGNSDNSLILFDCKSPSIKFSGDLGVGDNLTKLENFFKVPHNNQVEDMYTPWESPYFYLDSNKNIKYIGWSRDLDCGYTEKVAKFIESKGFSNTLQDKNNGATEVGPEIEDLYYPLRDKLNSSITPTSASGSRNPVDLPTAAMDFICVEVIGENVNLRDAPSAKGRVLGQVSASQQEVYFIRFIAEATPILDKSDNSTWYKLFFGINVVAGFERFDKSPYMYDSKIPYINAKFVKEVPLDDYYQKQIEYFKNGRPPFLKTGDFANVDFSAGDIIIATPRPVTLFLEPKENAQKRVLPAKTKIIIREFLGDDASYMWWEGFYGTTYYYKDMNDVRWWPVIGENKQIIGWSKNEYVGEY
jgi:hypothetical protein